MLALSRWIAPAALAAGLGVAAMTPSTARADDELVRVIVDIADVVLHGGTPYYRHGARGYNDRLLVSYDRHGRPVYYRTVPRRHRPGPPPHLAGYGYRYDRGHAPRSTTRCNRNGRCTVQYYDPRYDRDPRRRGRDRRR